MSYVYVQNTGTSLSVKLAVASVYIPLPSVGVVTGVPLSVA